MSRSGYCEDWDDGDGTAQLYRGAVDRALYGKRGQAFLREMGAALDAMPVKELHAEVLVQESAVRETPYVCALGSVAAARGLDVSKVDVEDGEAVGKVLGIARSMANEVAYYNDEAGPPAETPAARWQRMRAWVERHTLKAPPPNSTPQGESNG